METLLVTTKCPECGGSVRHLEGAYTFACTFCASVLRCQTEGVTLKYVITPCRSKEEILKAFKGTLKAGNNDAEPGPIRTIYKPFWYVKGMVYSCHSSGAKNDLEARMWSHTFEANSSIASSLCSLGLRSEVLKIEGYDSERFGEEDIVLAVTKSREEAQREATEAAEWGIAEPGWKYHKTTIVGERFALIYYPVISVQYSGGAGSGVKEAATALFDGISGAYLGKELSSAGVTDVKAQEQYRLEIVTHRCMNCGHDLEARDFDLVFHCSSCSRLWLLKGNGYHQQKVQLIHVEDEQKAAYIPFWRFDVTVSSESTGMELKTVGDLAGFMRMGRHLLRDEDGGRQLRFYIPAIVARNATAVLKLAGRVGTFQKELPVDSRDIFPSTTLLNVSLLPEEAQEMLRPLIFLVIGRIDRKAIDFFSDFKIMVADRRLVWYPFEDKGEYLLDRFHNYSFSRRSIDVNLY